MIQYTFTLSLNVECGLMIEIHCKKRLCSEFLDSRPSEF